MNVRFQWLQNLTNYRSRNDGYWKTRSEKKKKKEEEAAPVEFVTVHVGEHREKFDLPLEIFNSSTFKSFLKEHEDEIVLKRKPGLYCSIDDFKNMLALAKAEITYTRRH